MAAAARTARANSAAVRKGEAGALRPLVADLVDQGRRRKSRHRCQGRSADPGHRRRPGRRAVSRRGPGRGTGVSCIVAPGSDWLMSRGVIVLLAIRSDSYELPAGSKIAGIRSARCRSISARCRRGSYAEVIKGPAARLEGSDRPLKIEDALVDDLLSRHRGRRRQGRIAAARVHARTALSGARRRRRAHRFRISRRWAASKARSKLPSSAPCRRPTPIQLFRGIPPRGSRCCAAA